MILAARIVLDPVTDATGDMLGSRFSGPALYRDLCAVRRVQSIHSMSLLETSYNNASVPISKTFFTQILPLGCIICTSVRDIVTHGSNHLLLWGMIGIQCSATLRVAGYTAQKTTETHRIVAFLPALGQKQ